MCIRDRSTTSTTSVPNLSSSARKAAGAASGAKGSPSGRPLSGGGTKSSGDSAGAGGSGSSTGMTMAAGVAALKHVSRSSGPTSVGSVSYTHLRAHETPEHLVCRLLLEKKKQINKI
eukprot:TRINITY_DN35541_c0_g1_i1.p1 TRINITY_DN35541_c0_g1~~TRINITY_DN35541_c0_g1_i1.p1  ORF type:complete len:117 (+),score=31.75 TRINITY_DN35541_c0_g1_i1:152-502(+)